MSFDAGKIEGTLDLDRTPFQRGLREAKDEARRFQQGRYSATLDADTKSADAKIIYLKDRLDRLDRTRVTPKLSVDNAAGLVKLVDFNDRLDALRRKVATARADVDDAVARGKLDALDIQLRRVGAITARPRVTVEGVERANLRLDELALKLAAVNHAGGSSGGGLLGRLAGAGQGGFFGGMGLLGVAGGAAAVPLGVGALGLGASFLTPTVAGGLGLGLFGGASKAAFGRVSKAETQLQALNRRIALTPATKTGNPAAVASAQASLQAAQLRLAAATSAPIVNPATVASAQAGVLGARRSLASAEGGGANPEHDKLIKQRQQLLNQLTPAERKAADGIAAFEREWKHFQRALEPESFKLLATGTDIFRKGLHELLPMTKAVGDEVDHLATRADRALSKPFWHHFFTDFLAKEAPRAVDALGSTLGNLLTGFAHLSEDFSPLGHRLEDDFVRWSAIFDRWTQGSGPEKFVKLVERDGPIAAHALVALAHGLEGLATGLEPIGRFELQALTPVLNFIGELGKQHPAVITALGIAYLGVAGGLKAIAAVNSVKKTLDGASIGMSGLRRSAALTAGVIGTVEIGRHSGSAVSATLGGALTGLATGLIAFGPEGAVIGAFAGGIVSLGTYITSARGEVQSFTADVDALATSLTNAVGLDKGLLGGNVKRQVQQLLTTSPEFQKPGKYGHTLLETLAKYGVTIDDLIARAQGQYPADYAKMINAAHSSGNMDLINQATDLIFAIQQALRNNQDLGLVSGGSGGGGGKSGGRRHGGGGGGGGGGGSTSTTAGISLGQQGQQGGLDYSGGVAAGIVAGIPKVETAVVQLQQRVGAKLKVLQAQARQSRQSIVSGLLGQVGIGALGQQVDSFGNPLGGGGSVTGIISGLESQDATLRHFRRELALEHKRGLSARVEQQIAGLGLDTGGQIADTLDSATRGQLRHISSLDQLLRAQARRTGRSITGDIYGERIHELTSALHKVNETISNAAHRHKTLTETDYHHLRQILEEALHGQPVVFDSGKHSRKQAREVWTS